MAREWNEFNQFSEAFNEYLPSRGEGDTMATQVATAVSKLVYKWYNDGDVFDNTGYMQGWCNDLSSYANWLARFIPETEEILERIRECMYDGEYEDLLYDLCKVTADPKKLENWNTEPRKGSVYTCDGVFEFDYIDEEEDGDGWW